MRSLSRWLVRWKALRGTDQLFRISSVTEQGKIWFDFLKATYFSGAKEHSFYPFTAFCWILLGFFLMHCVNISNCFWTNVSMQAKFAWTHALGLRLLLKTCWLNCILSEFVISPQVMKIIVSEQDPKCLVFFFQWPNKRLSLHNFLRFFTSLPVAVARDFNNACSSLLHRAPMKINRPRSRGTSSSIRQSVVRL